MQTPPKTAGSVTPRRFFTGNANWTRRPLDSERIARELLAAVASGRYATSAEASMALGPELAGEGWRRLRTERLRTDPRERAQEMAFLALEEKVPSTALKLARWAIVLDPDCADALTATARLAGESVAQRIACLERAVEVAAAVLGPLFQERYRGRFWTAVETRPYLRAREALAETLWLAGKRSDAILHLESLIDHRPDDPRGLRRALLAFCLATHDARGARALLIRHQHDTSPLFVWGRALERVFSGRIAIESALARARRGAGAFEPLIRTGELAKSPVPLAGTLDTLAWSALAEAWSRALERTSAVTRPAH